MPQLIEYMKQHAYYTIPRGPVVTQRISRGSIEENMQDMPGKDPLSFEVVFMPEVFAKGMPSAILTQDRGKTMRVATQFKTEDWLGIMLAHEVSHVYDQLVEHENPDDPQQNAAGEVKAYLLEKDLLKYWNPDVYKKLIEKGLPLFHDKKYRELLSLAETLYPLNPKQVSFHESSLGAASIVMSLALEEAQQRGASEEEFVRVYKEVGEILSNGF